MTLDDLRFQFRRLDLSVRDCAHLMGWRDSRNVRRMIHGVRRVDPDVVDTLARLTPQEARERVLASREARRHD